jgi:predicted phage terminase large subunit-like protein
MPNPIESITIGLARSQFHQFVPYAFKKVHGKKLGDQPYVIHMCHVIDGLISGNDTRLLINLPPQHLKSFVGTICLAAYLLGTNPQLRILLVAYNDDFASSLCDKIRDMMRTSWYRAMFTTRIKEGHSRSNDFQTTEGGGIFAVAATGTVTGRTADFIIYDDPHEIGDWNNERRLNLVRNNFNTILSRLNNKIDGPVLVIAHRISANDLSADLLQERGWTYLRLPLVAPRRRKYDLGHDEWVREKGDILQPNAYSQAEIERLKRTQLAPPFGLFHQQDLDPRASFVPCAEHFATFEQREAPIAPVVLSIDPGQTGGSNASRSVIQAWKFGGGRYYVIDQFCDHCDFIQLQKEFWRFVKRNNPSVALIEKTANGPALYAAIRQKVRFEIKLIVPRNPKATRLARHHPKIRGKKICIPADAIWREAFINEIVSFPGEFDDQIDTMTQYFDYLDTKPIIPVQPPREHGIGIVLGSHYRRW